MCLVGASGKPSPSQSHKPESDVGDGGGGGNKMLCVCVCVLRTAERRGAGGRAGSDGGGWKGGFGRVGG